MSAPPSASAQGCLQMQVRQRLPHFTLELELICAPGEVLALVGPSGSGKTTLLRLIAGLDRLGGGCISLGDVVWSQQSSPVHLPPPARHVGMVFQNYPLFPHLSLLENVAFAAADPGEARSWLERFGIAHLGERRPRAVSGGERQRAAICQALARRPAVLLLDEPLSALDVDTRALARRCFRETAARWGLCLVLVTHDLLDAVAAGGRVEALIEGRLDRRWLESRLRLLSREVSGLAALASPALSNQAPPIRTEKRDESQVMDSDGAELPADPSRQRGGPGPHHSRRGGLSPAGG